MYELNYSFSVIGVSETNLKISTVDSVNFDTSIPGYKFEYIPTPLASGGVVMYVKDSLNYKGTWTINCFRVVFLST